MRGASFLGVLLIGLGVLLAYLYSSGKWPAVWAAIAGATLPTPTTGAGQPDLPNSSFGSYASFATGTSPTVAAVATPALQPTTANPIESVVPILVGAVSPQAYPQIGYSLN